MPPSTDPTPDRFRGPCEVVEMEDVEIDFPEEISSIPSTFSTSFDSEYDWFDEYMDFHDNNSVIFFGADYLSDSDDGYEDYFGSDWTVYSIPDTKEYEDLPAIDYKYSLKPTRQRKKGLIMKNRKGRKSFISYLHKELAKGENLSEIQNMFSLGDAYSVLAEKKLFYSCNRISLILASPILGISKPQYIDKMNNSELAKDFPVTQPGKAPKSSVVAVNLKWKNEIQVTESDSFKYKTKWLGPLLRETTLRYGSKTSFAASIKKTCDELFPDWSQNLVIINGHENTQKISGSANIQEDPNPENSYTGGQGDPHTRTWKECTDFKEHQILIVPDYSKHHGFNMDLSKPYEVPFKLKFIIGKRTYQHEFLFRLTLSRRPQHYGLIFTFSEDPKGHSKLRIKSLLTVYSIFPVSSKEVCLETYDTRRLDIASSSCNSYRKMKHGQFIKAARNAVKVLKGCLKEDKLLYGGFGQVAVEREFTFKRQAPFSNTRYIDMRPASKKKARKNQLQKDIKFALRDLDPDGSYDRSVGGSCSGLYDHTAFEDCIFCRETRALEYRLFRRRYQND